ncbi:hypothetical protein vseg_014121 [Gypsophila vaccaria]
MEARTSTLNPFAVAYIPVAKREVQEADKVTVSAGGVVKDLKSNVHQAGGSHGTTAGIPQEMDSSVLDIESEMDLAYLQMTFPGISVQFLGDVYNINGGDLEASIDMLSELESPDGQQDGLDIDNAVEPVSLGECSYAKDASVSDGFSSSAVSSGVTVSALSHLNKKTDKTVIQ